MCYIYFYTTINPYDVKTLFKSGCNDICRLQKNVFIEPYCVKNDN